MKITILGSRGSIPTTGPEIKKYGGNTSCTSVGAMGWQLLLDAGSGMRKANSMEKPMHKRLDILLTHLHMDHIQGLGFFKPLFDPEMEVHIWGPASSRQTLQARLGMYLSPPLFPVYLRDLPCKLHLHEIDNSTFEIGPFLIRSYYVIHPGPTVGYRVMENNKTFTYIPDHEPALGIHGLATDPSWISGFDLAHDVDLLLHDAQYTVPEYAKRKGWGHSSMEDTLRFAAQTGVKHLLLGHHDPGHSDKELEEMLADLKLNTDYSFEFELAKEGMEINL
jgi:phosphoribosyl 1,2-cyclic phosphodiesterase